MIVKKITKPIQLSINDTTKIDVKREMSFILSQKIIEDLFLLGEITLEEYYKITKKNLIIFKPYLYEIMP